MNLFSLEGKIAFVTGAGSGIGQRIAMGLAEAGASVGCFDLASSSGLNETVKQIEGLGCRALALTGDVTQADDLSVAIAARAPMSIPRVGSSRMKTFGEREIQRAITTFC